jgi:RNA polymerase sigma-70 factor (ECF subfamily)
LDGEILKQANSREKTEANADSKLILEAINGDMNSFEEIVRMFATRINSIAYRFTGSSEDARDISQEVFLKLYKALKKFDPQFKLSTWLYRITLNQSIDCLRKRGYVNMQTMQPNIREVAAGPDENAEKKEKIEFIRACLPQLSEHQRVVLVLRDFEEFTTDEIAEIFGSKPGTIRVHLARARIKIKELLRAKYPELFYENNQEL